VFKDKDSLNKHRKIPNTWSLLIKKKTCYKKFEPKRWAAATPAPLVRPPMDSGHAWTRYSNLSEHRRDSEIVWLLTIARHRKYKATEAAAWFISSLRLAISFSTIWSRKSCQKLGGLFYHHNFGDATDAVANYGWQPNNFWVRRILLHGFELWTTKKPFSL